MDYVHSWQQSLDVDVVTLIRLFCWASIVIIVVARLVPATRTRFLSYGARNQQVSQSDTPAASKEFYKSTSWLEKLISIDVPHSWFTHFYVLSLSLSLFWLTVVISRADVLRVVSAGVAVQRPPESARAGILCICLMVLQSTRRLYESIQFSSRSRSRMWIGHYIFGLAFYFFANLAVWIEGVHDILAPSSVQVRRQQDWLGFRLCVGTGVFLLSSYLQHLAHAHLASLPKYSVPRHWLFRTVVAPHYTAECVIYVALASIGAPNGSMFNGSILCIGFVTIVNLGITAHGTKMWMISKFRDNQSELGAKYCMLPGIW